ncbi:MAG: hypothetical protein ACKV2U_10545 [Bryobacteraceae bacterium]
MSGNGMIRHYKTAFLVTSLACASLNSMAQRSNRRAGTDAPVLVYLDYTEPGDKSATAVIKTGRSVGKAAEKLRELPEGAQPLPVINHWDRDLSQFPVTKCDTIVLGTVTRGRARYSDEGMGIVSEFDVKVETVMKETSEKLPNGSVLIASRQGGQSDTNRSWLSDRPERHLDARRATDAQWSNAI